MRELQEQRFWRERNERETNQKVTSFRCRFLRCGNDVNNAVGILSKELHARNLPVPFGVW